MPTWLDYLAVFWIFFGWFPACLIDQRTPGWGFGVWFIGCLVLLCREDWAPREWL